MALTDEQEKTLKAELDAEKVKSKKATDDLEAERATKKKKDDKEEDDEDEDDEDDDKGKGKKKDDEDDEGLRGKARKTRQAEEDKKNETKQLESALKFNLSVPEFVKGNKDLLPNEFQEILSTAEKERYDSALDKANALRAAFIQAFFSVEANKNALTTNQKSTLEDFLKLTRDGRESKAEGIYENVFEPALETLKKIKKAEEVGKSRSGFASGGTVENDYKARLIKNSRKAHLGEKGA